ncbi:MAG: cell envelope integrity protein TolA [Glaciimonas sp.]|nr:cell envelope integrity protein TolA [Glaciimonas sp.]
MTDRIPYKIPKEPGRWRAIVLAASVHAALVTFLWIGVQWQSKVPITVEAEVWHPNVREAAPKPPPSESTPKPIAMPAPLLQPEPKPVVQEAPLPPKVIEPVLPDPEIAMEKERKHKIQEQKNRARAEQAREDKERQHIADEQERKEQEKKDTEKQANKQANKLAEKLAEKQKANADAKKKRGTKAKKIADDKDKIKAKQDAAKKEKEKITFDKQHQADVSASDKRHNEDMKRLQGQASGSGASNSNGIAALSQGPRGDRGYAQKVGNKIKGNINFNVPGGMVGNPAVEFEVQLLPDGSVAGIQLLKSSDVSGFDEAVKRAIEKSAPYPKDKSGSVPPSYLGIHKPKDQ